MTERRAAPSAVEAASRATMTDSRPLDDPYIGATIDDRYEVEALIGEGGMGVVYRCRHIVIGKAVAMKVLRPEMARNDDVSERFLNEARSASLIGNSHIIDISDFGRLPDKATYIVMEFLEGVPLTSLLTLNESLDFERTVKISLQLAEGLAAAHEAGIIHRDLKPDNIFLLCRDSQKDFVKILDFGIAKANHPGNKLTQAGQVFGTPHYMSPEQASGSPVDQRSDIYSLGVILYEMLTGTLPFDADNHLAILSQHILDEPPAPSSLPHLVQPIPVELEQITLRCLAKVPENRFQTMGELATALYQVFGSSLGSQYPLPSAVAWAGLSSGTYAASSLPASSSSAKGRRVLWPVLGALTFIGIAAGAYFILPQEKVQSAAGVEMTLSAEKNDFTVETEKSVLGVPVKAEEPPEQPAVVQVVIAVSPLEAHVFLGDEDLGSSPVVLEFEREPLFIEVRADGYQSNSITVDGKSKKLRVVLQPSPKAAPTPVVAPRPRSRPAPKTKLKQETKAPKKKRAFGGGELVNPFD